MRQKFLLLLPLPDDELSQQLLQAETLQTLDVTTPGHLLGKQLIAAGALIHYPTIAVMINGKVRGSVIAGYKNTADYARLFESRIENLIAAVTEEETDRDTGAVTSLVS